MHHSYLYPNSGGATLADHNININFRDDTKQTIYGNPGRITQTTVNDDAVAVKIAESFKDSNKELAARVGDAVEKSLSKILKSSLPSTTDNQEAEVSKVVKAVAQELGNSLLKNITNSLPKSPGKTYSTDAISDSINKKTEKSIEAAAKSIEDKFSKIGLSIDKKAIEGSISSAVQQAIPKNIGNAVRDTTAAIAGVKGLLKDITAVAGSVSNMRKSGGKVDASEIGSVLSGIKKIISDVKTLHIEAAKAKESIRDVHSESKEIKENLYKSIDAAVSKATSVVTITKEAVGEDPKAFSKEIVTSIRDIIKTSDATKDSSLAKAISNLENKVGDIKGAIEEVRKLPEAIRRDYKEGKVDTANVDKLMKALSVFSGSIGNLPIKMDVSGQDNKTLAQIEEFSKGVVSLSKQITTVINDSGIKEIINKKVDVPVTLNIDKGKANKDIRDIVTDASNKSGKLGLEFKIKYDESSLREASALAKEINQTSNIGRVNPNINRDPLSRTKGDIGTANIHNRALYSTGTVTPAQGGIVNIKPSLGVLTREAEKIKADTEANIRKLSSSLYDLQKQIILDLEKGFKDTKQGWSVVRPSNNPDPTSAFKLLPGGRQWGADIVNERRLRQLANKYDGPIDSVLKLYKDRLIENISSRSGGELGMSDSIGKWLKATTDSHIKSIQNLDGVTKSRLIEIKHSDKGVTVGEEMRKTIISAFGSGDKLRSVYRNTYADDRAEKELRSTPDKGGSAIIKTISLPAAEVSQTGDATFQTVHGALRSLPKFAKFQTGFEVLYNQLKDAQAHDVADSFGSKIKKLPIRATGDNKIEMEQLSSEMVKAVGTIKGIDYIKSMYSEASKFKAIDVERSTAGKVKSTDFTNSIENSLADFTASNNKSISALVESMKSKDLAPYDVVKSLNKIETMNVYDVMNQVLRSGKDAPIGRVVNSSAFDKPVRGFEKAVREVEGLLPLMETNRPRRGYHQENTVNLLTRTSALYDNNYERLSPDDQKKAIKDLNLEISETINKLRTIHGDSAVIGVRGMSSLGIPESQAGSVEEYRPYQSSGFEHLNSLNATGFKMYSEDLSSVAPFKQFQQAGRNISNVTNAMISLSEGAETPKLRSDRERALIESGRYGTKGYGYNVTAELRNTAANFEDQIVIAGKLANALTSAVSTLVKPGPSGRVSSNKPDAKSSTGVTEIEDKKLRSRNEIMKVAKEYMKILGAPEMYDGRADEALIEAVGKTIAIVRGESVEVQKAKLSETFMNHYGRKLTTRYGSKGVSVTPTGNESVMADIIKGLGSEGFKNVKVDPSATLGVQVAPKSLGQLSSELLGDSISKELKTALLQSGNKFMVDFFQKDTVVPSDEAAKNKDIYQKFTEAWSTKFNEPAPQIGPEGIKSLRSKYTSEFGEASSMMVKPIDVRISSYGAAKRGLQTEFMESIFSNIASTGDGGYTTLKQLEKGDYDRLLKGGVLSKYSEALGYKGSNKSEDVIANELFKTFGGKGDYSEALTGSDEKNREKAILAKKAAALEAASTFYSDVIDEFGKKRTGLVGEKFLQIIEEPHKNAAWERGEIESGSKGARFNVPAFSAYASVFGKDSNFMKEVQGSLDINSKKHWEYMKALQSVQDKDSSIYKNLTSGLKTVDISNIKGFDYATGVYGEEKITDASGKEIDNPRSFSKTIFDIDRYPDAFKLQIPTGRIDVEGRPMKEDLYVPGASARQTYPDPLLAGEFGMDEVSRRLSNIVNISKRLEGLLVEGESTLNSENIASKIKPIVGKWVSQANSLSEEGTPESEEAITNILNRMLPALSYNKKVSRSLMPGAMPEESEMDFINRFSDSQMAKVHSGKKTKAKALYTIVGTVSDMIIGKISGGTAEQMKAPTVLSQAKDTGTTGRLAKQLGIDVEDETKTELNNVLRSLQKAKIEYNAALASTVLGKTGSVNELFLSRKIPSVIAKAVTAVTDKTEDLTVFRKRLESIDLEFNLGLEKEIDKTGEVSLQHKKAISGYKKIGVPTLKQHEIGIPETYASKIPVSYKNKYKAHFEDGVVTNVSRTKTEEVNTTLDRLLEHAANLREGSRGMDSNFKAEIDKYIEKELVPYVESIRFPFTGTSSIAPFKPKVIAGDRYLDKSGKPMADNTLIVPGVPEGAEGLSEVIKSIQDKIDSLSSQRESMRISGAPEEEINNLSKAIRLLNAAISDVIPKYSSQAQKLDFDGDQIEVHAARTAAARQDIQKHFNRFHRADPSKDIKTSDIFMQRFLADAATVKTTGPYVFGEAQGAFEKKFPSGKGFEFMKSPFLNEQLDYLTVKQSLDVLSGNDQIGDISNVLEDVLKDINRPDGEIIDILSKVRSYDKEDKSQGIVDAIEEFYGKDDITKTKVEKGIKRQLYESKMGDTVEAQLFKVHTGPENEAIYRIHRLAEEASGFSGGLIGSGKSDSSDYFKKRFPKLGITGYNPEEEFNTFINEISRFSIQKGMDVKHAGEKPVAGKIVKYLSRGLQGSDELWGAVQTDKQLGDLKDFAGDSEKAIRLRLGEMSTEDIMKDLSGLMTSRGESTEGLSNMGRSELIDKVVEKLGLKGFLDEMAILIRTEAVKGLIAQAETWSDEKKKSPWKGADPITGDIGIWAEKTISKQMNTGGIDISNTISKPNLPLYNMRTFLATPGKEFGKYKERYGDIPVPINDVSALSQDERKEYVNKHKFATATAYNLKDELQAFAGSNKTGAYAEMVRGTIADLYKNQQEIESKAQSVISEGYDTSIPSKVDLATRVTNMEGIPKYAMDILNKRSGERRFEIERLSDLVGIPNLSEGEKFETESNLSSVFYKQKEAALSNSGKSDKDKQEEISKYIEEQVERANSLKQLDRITDVLMTRKNEGAFLRDLMPVMDEMPYENYMEKTREQFMRAREAAKALSEKRSFENTQILNNEDGIIPGTDIPATKSTTALGGGGNMPPYTTSIPFDSANRGSVVPVHIVSADPSVTINIRGLVGSGMITEDMVSRTPVNNPVISDLAFRPAMDNVLVENINKRASVDELLKRIKPQFEKPVSMEEFFTPTKFSSDYDIAKQKLPFTEDQRRVEQLSGIVKNMTVREDMSPKGKMMSDWGTLLHTMVENAYIGKDNYAVEEYGEITDPLAGRIGGKADLLEYTSSDKSKVSKVIDIKSMDPEKYASLAKAIEETGSNDMEEVYKNIDDEFKRILSDYKSQLNTYLKIFGEDAVAELRFYNREDFGKNPDDYQALSFKFDEDRYDTDMLQVTEARERVKKSGVPFLKSSKPIPNNVEIGNDELLSAMQTIKSNVDSESAYKRRILFSDIKNRSDGSFTSENMPNQKEAAIRMAQRNTQSRLTPSEYDKYLLPVEPATGSSTKDIYTNLTLLHDQAKIYQKMKGVDIDDLSNFPKQIQEMIGKTRDSGPDYQGFMDLTTKLRESDPKNFSFNKSIAAWKAHRAAVGDWMIKNIKESERLMHDARSSGDDGAASQAYGTFEKRVNVFQEHIRRGIGKETDIYTDDKRFVYPALARSAGVYMSPADIMKKIGEPLGDDKQLINSFNSIIGDMSSNKMKTPVVGTRGIFRELSGMNKEAVELLGNAELMKRVGPEIINAWDFDTVAKKATRLREALQNVIKENGELDAEQKKNLQGYVSQLRSIENMYGNSAAGGLNEGGMDIRPVLRSESPDMQRAMNARNLQAIMKEYNRSSEDGGPKIGSAMSYVSKVMDSGQVVENNRYDFKKYGEEVLASGEKVGKFSMEQVNLVEKMQQASSTFGNAIRRVIMWGAASNLVYSSISYLSKSLDLISKIEVGMAELRMVMNTSTTDFAKMQKTAIGFGKQYGTPVPDVLKSMVIFAQQGLTQEEIIDRTRTATIAANVTTLNAKDATEALTAAMVVFREEGDRSLRFLDAWSEVEAKHAIEAGHMANAIKKSAAAAKIAGFDFDQLNGIVAAIGATTRQSGNEIGTSMRFISRRLFTEDGPKALAKLPKSVSTISPTGENRSGFDILSDLAGQWKDLTEAQKLNVATSIGGTRQYNSLLVMMDQWDEVLRGVNNSMNSKGSSERRNAEMMKTYAKQLEQTKAAATELKVELGGIVLPTFKAGLSGFKNLLEAVSAIPVPIKIAATAMTLLIGALGKGLPIIDGIAESMSKGKALFSNFGDALSSQMKIGKFELTGKGKSDSNVSLDLLKTVTTKGDLTRGTNLSDFHSAAGKTMFLLKEAALVYNRIIAQLPIIFGAGLEKAGEGTKSVGKFMSVSGGLFDSDKKKSSSDVIDGLRTASEAKGLGPDAIKAAFKGGPKALGKLGMKAAGFATEIAGIATTIVGEVIDTSGEYLGSAGHGMLKEFTNSNASLTKSMAPMLVTIAALAPAIKVAYSEFSKLNQSAQDFEDSMNGAMKANSDNLKNVRDTINKYNTIDSKLNDAQKASSPETKQRRMELGTYVAPIVTLQKTYGEIMDMTNSLAEENINLVVGYDKLGNAVLRTTDNFKTYFKELEKAKVKEGLSTDIEVMAKYVTDLTKTDGAEKFKVVMKDLAESFPVIGELISRNIKVSPAKALELATDDLNKRVNMKQKYPLSTAADEDIKRLQNVVKSARNAFKETYVGFETAYKKAVAPTNFKNFGKDEIESLLSSPEMMKAYELKLNVDPKFKIVKNVKPEDILGREVLAALNPDLAGVLDYNSRLTTANIETAGIHSRLDSKSDTLKLHNNDIITLSKYKRDGLFAPNMNTESIANNLDAAGNQAIVKMKKNIDGQFEWVAEYFNTKTLKIESRPIEDIESYVENIFPANKIKEDLSYRLDSLNTFVAGASAGLVGISPKDFKRDFNMGEKFFSEIPTSTLLQGDFGFEPGKGFGKVDSMSNYRKDIEDFYFKPMEELKTKMEVFDKARLEGMDKDDFTMSKESYDEIEKLLTILKNNQVILQFRSVFVELMKEFSEGERILKQNLAVAKNRFDYEKETGGLLKGVSKSAANYQLSGYKTSELTPMQSLVKRDSSAAKSIADIERMEMTVGSKLSQIDSISKAKVNINEIRSIAKATGASIDEKNIGSYVEKVAASMDESGPYKELNKSSTMIADNTKETVERLDALLENQGNPEAIKEMMSSILDKALFANKGEETAAAMERVAGIRSRAESKGNQEIVIETNKALDALTKKLIDQVGYEKGAELVSKGRKGSVLSPFMNFSSDFKEEEFRQRALGGMDPKVFMDKLDRYVPVPQKRDINSKWGSEGLEFFSWSKEPTGFKGSDEYKDITELQRKQNKKPLIDANTIAKTEAAMVAFSYMEKLGKERVSSRFDERIVDLDNQIKEAKALGKTEAFIRPLAVKQEALISEKGKVDKEAEFYGTVQALSSIGLAASEMAIAFGLTEKQVKALNVAAIGTYLAMKAASKATGEEIPRSAKEFEATFNKVIAGMMSTGEAPSRSDLKDLRDKGGILQEEVDKHNKNVFGKSGTDLNKYLENQKKEEEKLKTLKDDKSIKEAYKTQTKSAAAINAELDVYRNSSEEAKKYDEMFRRQQKERQDLSNEQGGYKPETDEYKDMDVRHKTEQFEWARNISKEEAQRLKDSYPKTNPLSGDYSKKLQENYTSEMQNYCEKARRGAEKDVGTN